ncbi:MAG TPA: DnaD domain protein [Anaerolineales bacterium]|nr:DnaD domain protein [Anaerolineales bacterium]
MSKKFKGFTDSETFTQIPDGFFQHLLKDIKDADELKVTLYFLWQVEHMDGPLRALRKLDFDVKALGLGAEAIRSGLEKAVRRGSLLRVEKEADVYFLLNSPRGRAAVEAIKKGTLDPSNAASAPMERPNIFRLYEENIGPLTPLIADALKDAEELYQPEWIADAIELAVKNNKRNWKYCEAILKRWKEEGRAEKQGRRDPEKDRRKYVEGEYSDFIEH